MNEPVDIEDEQEYVPEFASEDCECGHEPREHGWSGCGVEPCECEASWTE